MARLLVFAVLVLLTLIQPGCCLKCYKCEPKSSGSECMTSNGKLEECDEKEFLDWATSRPPSQTGDIVKAFDHNLECTTLHLRAGNESLVTRTCLPDSPKVCEAMKKVYNASAIASISCHFCDTDGCNGAGFLAGLPVAAVCLIFLTLMMFY